MTVRKMPEAELNGYITRIQEILDEMNADMTFNEEYDEPEIPDIGPQVPPVAGGPSRPPGGQTYRQVVAPREARQDQGAPNQAPYKPMNLRRKR